MRQQLMIKYFVTHILNGSSYRSVYKLIRHHVTHAAKWEQEWR